MFSKIVVLIFILAIFYCLGSALFFMLSRQKAPNIMAKALTWRIVLSITLFLLLLLGFYLGLIHPHGIE
jgi:hypothetical protein